MPIAESIDFKREYLETSFDIDLISNNAEIPECRSYSVEFRKSYYDNNGKNIACSKLALFLSIICEFNLKDSNNKVVLQNYLSNNIIDIINDFDIEIIESLIQKTNNPELNARVYDIIWSVRKDYSLVNKILENYFESIKILVNYPYWTFPIERFKRFIYLGKLTNNRQLETASIEYMIDQANNNEKQKSSFFAINLAEYLNEIGLIKPYYTKILHICESQATTFCAQADFFEAAEYYNTLSKICHSAEDYDNEKKYVAQFAEIEVLEGEDSIKKENSYFKASHFYSIAVESYKKIDNIKRYDELHTTLLLYQQKSMLEFKTSTFSIDCSESINYYNEIFSHLNFYDSIIQFAKLFKSPAQDQINRYIENQKNFIGNALFPSARVNEQGKVIAIGISSIDENNREKYNKQMAFEYLECHWNTYSHTIIPEFLRHVSLTIFRKKDIQRFVIYNPLIELNRAQIFIDGLYEGLEGNFSTSIHLLIPQVEYMFRLVLISNGKAPSKIVEGIQEELNINDMLMRDEYRKVLEQVFGTSMVLDLEALLIGRMGMNLRNKLAHGLLTYDDSFSSPAIYFFCVVLKIVVLGWIIENRQDSIDEGSDNMLAGNYMPETII